MPNLFFYFFSFLVVIGVLVVAHEFGHYAAARIAKVKVLRFSIGFGPVLLKRTAACSGTEWVISLIPLGGYVKMLDSREITTLTESEKDQAFDHKSIAHRSFIVAAGPIANFLIAIFFYFLVNSYGGFELKPYLGIPEPDTFAAANEVQEKDLVLSVNEKAVKTWEEFHWRLLDESERQESLKITLQNNQSGLRFLQLDSAEILSNHEDANFLKRLGFTFYQPKYSPLIGKITPNSPADKAGLQSEDRIVQVNGKDINTWREFVLIVRENPDRELVLSIQRAGQSALIEKTLCPEVVVDTSGTFGRIGASLSANAMPDVDNKVFIQYASAEALYKASKDTFDQSVLTLKMFFKMLTGQVSIKNISGPITIADYAGQSAKMGLDYYLRFMALVSISLGVLNLLPVPVLDGGHLLYYLLEAIRGKPLSESISSKLQRVGLAFILMMMSLALFNDFNRLFFG